jgi:hypothetical protein
VVVSLELIRPDIAIKRPLSYQADIVNKDIQSVVALRGSWTEVGKYELRLAKPLMDQSLKGGESTLIMRLGGCYIPRDFGVSLDDRLLGVRILSIAYH